MACLINAKSTGVGGIDASGDASGVLALQTGGTTAVTIGTGQLVGINTTSTGGRLAVNGNPPTAGAISSVASSATGFSLALSDNVNNSLYVSHPAGGSVKLSTDGGGQIAFATNGLTEAMRIDASQNVGIGTASPSAKLDFGIAISGTAGLNNVIRLYNNATNSFGFGVASGQMTYNSGDAAHVFYQNSTTPTERMRIDSSGNLLKGVTSAYSTAYGTGEISFATNSAGMVFKCLGASGGSVPTVQVFLNAAGTAVGYIAVGASATNFTNLSDYRLKENVQPLTGALDRLSNIKPVTYDWIESGEAGEGFLAHELQEECPIAVVGNKDDVNEDGSIRPQGVDVAKIVPLLTAAIQELKAIIDTQQQIMTDLNTRITALEAK